MISSLIKELKLKNYQILLGVELEFYTKLGKQAFEQEGVLIKNEIGEGQLEAVFEADFNILQVLRKVIHFRNKFARIANFNAFVGVEQPPSALQFSFSLWREGENIIKSAYLEGIASEDSVNLRVRNNILYYLLESIPLAIPYFAPTANCLKRISNYDGVLKFRNFPVNISCGWQNNRTTAIRMREGRVEHRVPSSNCLILKSFNSILEAILKGVEEEKELQVPILYSNAFEEETIKQFNLKPLI